MFSPCDHCWHGRRRVPYREQSGSPLAVHGQSKRPLGLLLGAGCPASIQVDGRTETRAPHTTIDGLTTLISESIDSSKLRDQFRGLVAQLTEDQLGPPNLEAMLSRLRTLATVAGTHEIRGLTVSAIDALKPRSLTPLSKPSLSISHQVRRPMTTLPSGSAAPHGPIP